MPGSAGAGLPGAAGVPAGGLGGGGLSWSWELDLCELVTALAAAAPGVPARDAGGVAGQDGDRAGLGAEGGEEDQEAIQDAVMERLLAEASADGAGEPECGGASAVHGGPGRAGDPGQPGTPRAGRRLSPGELAGRVAEVLPPGPGLAALLAPAAAGEPAAAVAVTDLPAIAVGFRRLGAWAAAGELAAVARIAAFYAARDAKVGLGEDGRPERVSREAATEVGLAEVMSPGSAAWWTHLAVELTWRLPAVGAALAAGQVDYQRAKAICDVTSRLPEDKARVVAGKVLAEAGRKPLGWLYRRLRDLVVADDPDGAEDRQKNAEADAAVHLYPDEDGTAALTGRNLPAAGAAAAMARLTALARARKTAAGSGKLDLHRAQVFLGLLLGTLGLIPPAEGAPPDGPPPGDDPSPDDGPPPGDGEGPAAGSPEEGRPGRDCPVGDMPLDGGEVPPPGDEDAPADDGLDDGGPVPADPDAPAGYADGDDERPGWVVPCWPRLPAVIPGVIPAAFLRQREQTPDRPIPGLLDLTLPWSTLVGVSGHPGRLGRIGTITPATARQLAALAVAGPAAVWRVIVTSGAGQAVAVARVPRSRGQPRAGPVPARTGPGRAGPGRTGPGQTGTVGRVTVTISTDSLGRPPPLWAGGTILAAILRAARRAAEAASKIAEANQVAGGCAHTRASPAYRPPPRLREYVVARDGTCRNPVCSQPAWQSDLDHTVPWDKGGITCDCDLGGRCRGCHQVKQRPGWKLEQTRPGHFTWTTPLGRSYHTGPDTHPV